VVSSGIQVADTLNQLSSQLQTIETQASQQYTAITGASGEVQSDASQIAQLNEQIKNALLARQQPNDLEDRRDLLVDKLSELANVTVSKESDGTYTVSFGNAAKPLVEGGKVNWPQELTSTAGGKLGALLEISSETGPIAGYRKELDTVAAQLAESVNEQLAKTPGKASFFSGKTATTLTVAVKPNEVQTYEGANTGGNEVARAIAGLRGGTAERSYASLIARVGADVQAAQSEQTNSQAVVSAISEQRQSVSGVSLDEEMTNLVTFQRGYQASARALSALDEMLDTLINHTGAVGL